MDRTDPGQVPPAAVPVEGKSYVRVDLHLRNDRYGERWQLDVTHVQWDAEHGHRDGRQSFTSSADSAWIGQQITAFLNAFGSGADLPLLFLGRFMDREELLASAKNLMLSGGAIG